MIEYEFNNSVNQLLDMAGTNLSSISRSKHFNIDKKISKSIVDKTITDEELKKLVEDIKKWAFHNGADFYTHWFHPLRGTTAEKHDSFYKEENGKFIKDFSYNDLLRQEPDASSFPSSGIRNTFESRGYTIWDPSSPLFILDDTLFIPTIFISYNGDVLDYKTPLLRSIKYLNDKSTKVLKDLLDFEIEEVIPTLGCEQEFFLIDRNMANTRPDIQILGKTVFGHSSAKDQQLSDHYFGSMPMRVKDFMRELSNRCHDLGIPLKTRHNEVAPSQFECAPVFEDVNTAIDHNQLLMHLLSRVAKNNGLKLLLNEKPFAGVNGSGKHNNWSMMDNNGNNLLSPGKTKEEKLRFLVFFINIIKSISNYPDLLRASVATPENETRLGGHEAPPAIMSVFIGDELTEILNKIMNNEISFEDDKKTPLSMGVIPDVFVDNTDRNRTSPFAFTGNKFEFRSPGSSVNCSKPMTILNMIVGDQLDIFYNDIKSEIDKGVDKETSLLNVLKTYIKEIEKIRFNGDNYSEDWLVEAEKRGLSNIKSTVECMDVYMRDDTISLYEKTGVLNKKEVESRYEIKLEKYMKKVQIESRMVSDLAMSHIIPSAIKYLKSLSELQMNLPIRNTEYLTSKIEDIYIRIDSIYENVQNMTNYRKKYNKVDDIREMADGYSKEVFPLFEKIRYDVDKLELIIDDEMWTLPKYRELLFSLD